MRSLIALLLSLWLAPALAQVPMTGQDYRSSLTSYVSFESWQGIKTVSDRAIVLAQVPMTGAGKGTPGGFVGPLDVYTSSPYAAYSCSRALSAAKAAAQANLCELVDSAAPTTPICTLKAKTNGYVDLTTASCTGGMTPSAACTAATGNVCNIWKVYDQSGNSRDAIQATAPNQPTIRFNSTPSGTLPAIDCSGGTKLMDTSGTVTQAQPLSMSAVYFHPVSAAAGGGLGVNNAAVFIALGATTATTSGGSSLTASVSDTTWYAVQGLMNGNGTSSAVNVNGSDTTGAAGTTGFSGSTIRLCRANASQFAGYMAEGLIWASATNATDRGNIATNQRSSTYGYNF